MNDPTPSDRPSSETKHAKRLFFWGAVISSIYLALMAIYTIASHSKIHDLPPDQFATFVSGIFGPLAFLWLVLGFRQQGDELQNSARALWLQGEELRNSVEQQRQLVEVSRLQLESDASERARIDEEAERSSQPHFLLSKPGGSYSGPQRSLRLVAVSGGPTCSRVSFSVKGAEVGQALILKESQNVQAELHYDRPEDVQPVDVAIEYTDLRGNRRRQTFLVPVEEHGGPNGDRTLGEPRRVGGVERLPTPAG